MDTPPIAAVDPVLIADTYGKSRVRLIKLARFADRHHVKEITFQILFQGDFKSCYETGDNSKILPTDTIKNTVYVLARKHDIVSIEEFGELLIQYFLANNPQVSSVRIEMTEHLWSHIAPAAFTRESQKRTAVVSGKRDALTVEAGIDDLTILKSGGSAFEGYIQDPYTTLKETKDRIFATAVRARWRYGTTNLDFNALWQGVRQVILDSFAAHDSLSVQHTLHALGRQVLAVFPDIVEIQLTMPNKHALLVDLSPFGLDNPNQVFLPIDEPSGYIEGTLARGTGR
ncbi:MAG TPA: urate oxidase [Bryobacteraceae bacterium]|jgi:urate oxidase|nr:urate oxidase [Bryobacteraceae bacterium]